MFEPWLQTWVVGGHQAGDEKPPVFGEGKKSPTLRGARKNPLKMKMAPKNIILKFEKDSYISEPNFRFLGFHGMLKFSRV